MSIKGVSKIFILFLFISFLIPKSSFAESAYYYENEINKLNGQVDYLDSEIYENSQKEKEYKNIISQKTEERVSLENQKKIIETEILKTELEIKTSEKKIEKNGLEIESLDLEIEQKEADIESQKGKIGEFIRLIDRNDKKNILEVVFLDNSFSEFFDHIKHTEAIELGIKNSLEIYKKDKDELRSASLTLKTKNKELEINAYNLTAQKDDLESRKTELALLIETTKNKEAEYQKMVQLAVAEKEKTQRDLVLLERKIREQTSLYQDAQKKESIENQLLEMGGGISNNSLSWPVPFKAVTAYFHDADYPYKHIIGEHSGIDLRASQGTPIKAPAAGYVARVYDAGMGYSYLMVIHTNGISTLYGHVSSFNVIEDQYVQEGQIIAYTGGIPGTRGAGPFCTGPHLHFEVRLNGIPVNPLEYLKVKNIF